MKITTRSHQPLRRERRPLGGVKTVNTVVCLDYGSILKASSQRGEEVYTLPRICQVGDCKEAGRTVKVFKTGVKLDSYLKLISSDYDYIFIILILAGTRSTSNKLMNP